jgi:hypothetical protein
MTVSAIASRLFDRYEEYRLDHITPALCRHGEVFPELERLAAGNNGIISIHRLGESLEGRPIPLVSCGRGKTTVLAWSQMHGDEPTATLALIDILQFLAREASGSTWVQEMLSEISFHAIPMLNPDGAEVYRRETATQIDMNRDARLEATPEGKLLRKVRAKLKPEFGFNLHDQSLSTVGTSNKVVALAFLAPPGDESGSSTLTRVRAMRVIALIVKALDRFAGGHFAAYDDTYEPRAFGDAMQSWGTSTILIESGQWPKDPEKQFIRKLNFVGLLSALRSIGNNSYQDAELGGYTGLQKNGKRAYHYIVHDVLLHHHSGWSHRVDLGLEVDPASRRQPTPTGEVVRVKEVGDLRGFGALETIHARGRKLPVTALPLDEPIPLSRILDLLQVYHGS